MSGSQDSVSTNTTELPGMSGSFAISFPIIIFILHVANGLLEKNIVSLDRNITFNSDLSIP